MKRDPLRVGIIGMGFGARVHLPAFLSIPTVCVVSVADSGSGRAREVAANLGQDIRACDSWEEVVEGESVDAISVATPPYVQAEIVCAAVNAGKHVLCEKPFGLNAKEAVHMLESTRAAGWANAVDFEFRMEPGIAALKRLVESGEIGAACRIEVRWLTAGGLDPSALWSWRYDTRLGGGVLNGFVSHTVDYVEWIFGSRISRVSARCGTVVRERKDAGGNTRKVTAEDHCELLCDLASGAVAELTISNCSASEVGHRIEIHGAKGKILYLHEAPFTPDKMSLRVETNLRGGRDLALEPLPGLAHVDSRVATFRQLAMRFVDVASGLTGRDLPDFSCGLRVRRILDAARESSRLGKAIPVSDDYSVSGVGPRGEHRQRAAAD